MEPARKLSRWQRWSPALIFALFGPLIGLAVVFIAMPFVEGNPQKNIVVLLADEYQQGRLLHMLAALTYFAYLGGVVQATLVGLTACALRDGDGRPMLGPPVAVALLLSLPISVFIALVSPGDPLAPWSALTIFAGIALLHVIPALLCWWLVAGRRRPAAA